MPLKMKNMELSPILGTDKKNKSKYKISVCKEENFNSTTLLSF